MEVEPNFEYPKAKYRAGCEPIVVNTPEEEAELPDGWFSNPNDVPQSNLDESDVYPNALKLPKRRGRPPKVQPE